MSYHFWGAYSKNIRALKGTFEHKSFRKKLMYVLIFLSSIASCVTYYVFAQSELNNINSNHLTIILNIDLLILMLLTLAIVRKLSIAWADRKSGNQAAKLHTRFVMIFSLLTITPAILMMIFSAIIFNMGIQKWFSSSVSTALSESTKVAQSYLAEHKKVISANVYAMAQEIAHNYKILQHNQARFNNLIDTQIGLRNIDEALVFNGVPEVIARSKLSFTLEFEVFSALELKNSKNEVVIKTNDAGDRVRALIKIAPDIDAYLLVGRIVDPAVSKRIKDVQNAVSNYNEVDKNQTRFQLYLGLIFIAIAFVLLLIAVWVALVFAGRIAKPIGSLISASEKVIKGDLSIRVNPGIDKDEISLLMNSFNRMTTKLEKQKEKLVQASASIDSRRRFIEDILSSVRSGVISIDRQNIVQIINDYASDLLNITDIDSYIGKKISSCFPEVEELLNQFEQDNKSFSRQIKIIRKKEMHTLHVHLQIIRDSQDHSLCQGYIISFVNITHLLYAQRKAAWADVARRIAHEIRNPLTPIQLSAEQLQRKYATQITKDAEKFDNCVATIVRQVSHIGDMVKSFSDFAKMPDPNMQEEDIIKIIKQHIEQYKTSNPDINFVFRGPSHQHFVCDAAQISQVLTNIMQNSIDSIYEQGKDGKISISVTLGNKELVILVKDTGSGFPQNTEQLAEPYVTTKPKGTGLGLAIVKKIIEDHGGRMNLETERNWSAVVRLVFHLEG